MDQIVTFVSTAANGSSYTCVASKDNDIKSGSPSILVVALGGPTDNKERIGGVRFAFSLIFLATFRGNWDELIYVAQKRFESEKWIDRIVAYPNEILEIPFEQ